jgi:hypothetical protein
MLKLKEGWVATGLPGSQYWLHKTTEFWVEGIMLIQEGKYVAYPGHELEKIFDTKEEAHEYLLSINIESPYTHPII